MLGGTTDINGNGDVTAEWLDGTSFDYVDSKGLWFTGEPSGRDFTSDTKPLEPYVMLWNVNDKWSFNDNSDAALDYYKHSYIGYICEFDEY